MKYIKYLLIIVTTLSSCHPDDHKNLGKHCFLMYGLDINFVYCNGGMRNIYGDVIGYNFDTNFVVLAQKPNFENYRGGLAEEYTHYDPLILDGAENCKQGIVIGKRIADSILANDSFYINIFKNKINYWIISDKDSILYGPYNRVEYIACKAKLKVSGKLKLYSYRDSLLE